MEGAPLQISVKLLSFFRRITNDNRVIFKNIHLQDLDKINSKYFCYSP